MGKYSKAFSIKKQFQSPNCQRCQGQSRTMKKFIFLELFLRIIEDEKWNLFEKLGQLRNPSVSNQNESKPHSQRCSAASPGPRAMTHVKSLLLLTFPGCRLLAVAGPDRSFLEAASDVFNTRIYRII